MGELAESRDGLAALAPIRRVAIIGAGGGGAISGAILAALCVRAGFETVLEDVLPSNLRRAAAILDPAEAPRYANSIEDAVRDADLVIDTVPDELESKLEILTMLDRMAPPHTLFVTPTETLSIADLASCTYRPGQCLGLRILADAPLEVELAHPPRCAAQTLERVERFLRELSAKVHVQQDLRSLP